MKIFSRTLGLRSLCSLATVIALAACAGNDSSADRSADQTPMSQRDTGTMSSMGGMQGMQGMTDNSMMTQMQSHMRMMDGMRPDSMLATLPTHRQMVANMIAGFNKDMRDMNMTSDNAWNSTVDSLRQDLTRMTEMSASELQQFMSAHAARVSRLMGSHQAMMKDMKM